MNNGNTTAFANKARVQDVPSHNTSATERNVGRRTVISKPGAIVEVTEYDLPDHIREAIARNLGIGTGEPRPAG